MIAASNPPRRVVTAQREDGRSYFARVEEVPETDYGATGIDTIARAYPGWEAGDRPEIRVVWGCEELPFDLPVDPALTPSGAHPGPRGIRVSIVTYPPGWRGEMFWSNRVDILWLLSGELTYTTDGGDETVLRPGDVVIQNGTNKAFSNRGAEPAMMGAVMCGALRTGATPPLEDFHGREAELRELSGER